MQAVLPKPKHPFGKVHDSGVALNFPADEFQVFLQVVS